MKEWIKENLFKNNTLIKTRIKKQWFINNNILDKYIEISNLVPFIDNENLLEKIYCIMNNIIKTKYCSYKNCNNKVKFSRYSKGYNLYCSKKCLNCDGKSLSKRRQTCLERYGVENVFQSKEKKEKIKTTNLKKYGVENVSNNDEIKRKISKINKIKCATIEVRNKRKQTCLERYGVENVFQSKEKKEKIKITNLKKYGVENVSNNDEIKEKKINTCIKNYGVEHPLRSNKIKEKIIKTCLAKYGVESYKQKYYKKNCLIKLKNYDIMKNLHHDSKVSLTEMASMFDTTISNIRNYLKKHKINIIHYYSSFLEKEISNFININEMQLNNRNVIPPYELDVYIPKYKLAIEFNGLYWHSKHPKNYHLNKTEMCKEKNIQLLHIFENEWIDSVKQDIWKSIINSKLGKNNRIFARKTEVKEVNDNKLVKEFLNNNHLQGFAFSSIKLGLFHKDELVSLMIFGKTRFSKKYQYEMIRFCTKKFINVIGGASKLYKYFIDIYKPKSIISYADRRYSNGNLYEKLGFEFSHYSDPNYWYFKKNENILYSRIKFQKYKLKNLLESFDKNKSEIENMIDNNYSRIFDCGNIIYKFIR